jgi:hypothetical protein
MKINKEVIKDEIGDEEIWKGAKAIIQNGEKQVTLESRMKNKNTWEQKLLVNDEQAGPVFSGDAKLSESKTVRDARLRRQIAGTLEIPEEKAGQLLAEVQGKLAMEEEGIEAVNYESDHPDEEAEQDYTLATLLSDHAAEMCELFTDDRGEPCAAVWTADDENGHHEVMRIRSRSFRRWLQKQGRIQNENNIPGSEAISMALRDLEAKALYDAGSHPLHNRVARHEGAIWIDLADERHRAIRVDRHGWNIVDDPPILFRRSKHQEPLPEPTSGGNPWTLFQYANIPEEKQLLVLCYTATCLIPDIYHPIPIFHGEPGSGKSHAMRFIRDLVDPSRIPLLEQPKKKRDLIQQFDHHWMPFFDNMRTIPNWLSDMLCRSVTGAGIETRKLYTDEEAMIREYNRCPGINAINVTATQSDLLDRSFLVEFEPIDRRKDEANLTEAFKQDRPDILGGLLDVLVSAMSIYEDVNLSSNPRMLGFAKWGFAVAQALDGAGETFLEQYRQDEQHRIQRAIENNPIGKAVLKLMEDRDEWIGTTEETLEKLEDVAEEHGIRTSSKQWPGNPAWLTRRLKPVKPMLRRTGIRYETPRSSEANLTRFHKK